MAISHQPTQGGEMPFAREPQSPGLQTSGHFFSFSVVMMILTQIIGYT